MAETARRLEAHVVVVVVVMVVVVVVQVEALMDVDVVEEVKVAGPMTVKMTVKRGRQGGE